MKFVACNEVVGKASTFDLYLFKALHLITFKRTKWIPKQIAQITKDLKQIKSRYVY